MNYELFHVNLAIGAREDVLASVKKLVGVGGAVFTVNSLMLERAAREEGFRSVLNSADICTVDGVGVKTALALRGISTDILTGVDLGELLVGEGSPSLALIGGKDGVALSALAFLKGKNAALRESFAVSGYGYAEDEYISLLHRHRPRFCYVCLGSPKQECFILRAREASPATLFLALGGSLDVYSGEKRRAPRFMRALGLEWLYRMVKEPKRAKELPHLLAFSVRSLKFK